MPRDRMGTIVIYHADTPRRHIDGAGIFYSRWRTVGRRFEGESPRFELSRYIQRRYNTPSVPDDEEGFTDRPIKLRYFRRHVDGTCDKLVTPYQWAAEFFETSLNPARVSNVPRRVRYPALAHTIIFNIADADSGCGVSAFYLIRARST